MVDDSDTILGRYRVALAAGRVTEDDADRLRRLGASAEQVAKLPAYQDFDELDLKP